MKTRCARKKKVPYLLVQTKGVLGLVKKRVVVLVRIAAESVTNFLCGGFLALRMNARSGAVSSSFELVTQVLGCALLIIWLHGSRSLISETFASVVGHDVYRKFGWVW